jgi:tetratricopeptide (TPR) repeat protein
MSIEDCFKRAEAYINQGDIDRAIAEFAEALRLDPNLAVAKENLGIMYYNRGLDNYKKGNSDQAISDLSEAITFYPNNAAFYDTRGTIYATNKNNDKAIDDFTEVIRIAPTMKAYYSRSWGYDDKSERYRLAGDERNFYKYINLRIKDIEDALKIAPADDKWVPQMREQLESALNIRDHNEFTIKSIFKKKMNDANEVIRRDPNNAQAYCDRAVAYSALGNFAQAIADFTKAISLSPSNYMWYQARGWEYGRSGDHKQAIEDYKMSLQLNPTDNNIRNTTREWLEKELAGTMTY